MRTLFPGRNIGIVMPIALLLVYGCTTNDLAPIKWTKKADLPLIIDARHHPVTFSIGGFGYYGLGSSYFATCGSAGPNNSMADFYRYDPAQDSWKKLKNFPGGSRSFSYGVTYNGKAYLGFGQGGGFKNDLWEYDPTNDSWKELMPCPCAAREHPAMVQLNDKIYVGMGNESLYTNLKDWWEYDITNNLWGKKDDLPGPARHHPFYFSIGEYAYVGFGHGTLNVDGKYIYRDFYQYDPIQESWTRLNNFPGMARVAGTQFTYKGKGYVLSGDNNTHNSFLTGEFWCYDPLTDSWKQLDSHPGTSRWAPGSFVIDNKLFFTSGTTRNKQAFMRDLFEFQLQ
jgi:N-acetylneuraminic acid mutarotase